MKTDGTITTWLRLVLAATLVLAVSLATFGMGQPASAADPVVAVDDAGPDDEPGQKDLNSLSVDYGAPGATDILVTFNFDNTSTTGANTLDGCALFDTDGDGFANFAQCHTILSNGTEVVSQYRCTADSRADRCAGPEVVSVFASTSTAAIVPGSDPFRDVPSHTSGNTCSTNAACYTDDYVVTANIAVLEDFGSSATLINVCSYPSAEPNSDPSDCVFAANNGFLTIVKTTDQATSQQFVFNASSAAPNGQSQFSTTGAGTVSTISYAPTTTLDLAEVVPAEWMLDSASCEIQTSVRSATGTPSATGTGVDNFEIRSGLTTVCTFDNVKLVTSLTLVKEVINDNGGGAVSTDWTLTAAGGPTPISGAGGATSDNSFQAGTYGLTESAGPSGYGLTSLTCDKTGAAQVAAITVAIGEQVTCTFVNNDVAPSLTLVKEVVNDNGGMAQPGDFTLTAAGYDAVSPDAGSYVLSESGPSGYTQTSLTCTNATGQVTSVTLGLDEDVTCTFVNDDVAPSLTLVKEVVNDNGGAASPGDFTLTAAGYDAGSPDAGSYVLSESGPLGYTQTSLTCTNAPGQVTSVTLGLDEDVTCTFVNDDDAPSLTLIKTVVNNNGGTAVAADFTLTADGYDGSDPQAGTYPLSETGPDGYTQVSLTCSNASGQVTSVTLGLGDDVTCTFVNDDVGPGLTLVKEVVNDNGGTAVAADFTLTADGYDGSDPQAGTYPLSETGPDGYTQTSLTCSNSTGQVTSVSIGLGEAVVCTFVNDDDAPSLTLIKTVINNNGGTALPGDFTLVAAGYDAVSPDAGSYVLSESGPLGYTRTSLMCSNATGQVTSVTLGLGEDVTCTFVNDDDAPSLTLIKTVVNDNGGTAVAGDFTLVAAGYDAVSPDAGSYVLSESGPSGYTRTSLMCSNATGQVTSVTLGLGEDVVCTFVNDDDAPSLTLLKTVVNDNGGTAVAADFSLTAAGYDGSDPQAGTYPLSETGPGGYTQTSLTCSNSTGQVTSVSIGLGETVVCTFVNDDEPVDLQLTKDDGGVTAIAGGAPFDYTIAVQNVGTRDIDAGEPVTVTDELPAGLVWVTFPANCSQAGQVLTCDIDGALLPAGGDPIVITATVRALANAASGTYVNRASVTTQDDTTTNPPCPATDDNNVDCEPTPVSRTGGVQIIKTDDVADGATVQTGSNYSYSLLVTNTGVSTILPGMVVSDDLPSALELVSVTGGAGWTCNNADPISCTYAPSLAPAASAPNITVTVRVAAGATGATIDNVAVVNGVVDTDKPVTDDDGESTPLVAQADLAIVKTASVAQVGAGGGFDWILDVTNNGPGTANDVTISDFVPSGLTVTGVVSGDFSCGNTGNNVTCSVGSLSSGGSGRIRISVTTLVSAGGDVINAATVAASTPDPDLSNNRDDARVTIVAQAPPPVTLPKTGSDLTRSASQAAILLVLLGGSALMATRRRRDRLVAD